jgi:hypothetical protein
MDENCHCGCGILHAFTSYHYNVSTDSILWFASRDHKHEWLTRQDIGVDIRATPIVIDNCGYRY